MLRVKYKYLLLLCLQKICHGLRSIVFPLRTNYQQHDNEGFFTSQILMASFQRVVDSTDFFITSSTPGRCSIPLFGDDVFVSFGPNINSFEGDNHDDPADDDVNNVITEYILRVHGETLTQSDFGWVLLKFFECCDSFEQITSTGPLRKAVADHCNARPPHPGYDAQLFAPALGTNLDSVLDFNLMETIKNEGFAFVDLGHLKTCPASNQRLSQFLLGTDGQDPSVRRDKIAFLDRNDAASCGLERHYDFLMSIASHLNKHFSFEPSVFQPVQPATRERPLTNPKHIQAAEYTKGAFYVAHSDNSIAEVSHANVNVRSNFRCFTCILYCNDDWTVDDGGALRIYRHSTELQVPADAVTDIACPHLDILPINGRLLIFDSKLVHSVEPVLRLTQRRALTLWILRPEDNGAKGELYYFGQNEH